VFLIFSVFLDEADELIRFARFYLYSTSYLRSIKQATGYYWQYHFSTIGIIGMNEACLNFLGTNIAGKAGLEFSLKVMDFIRG